MASSPEATGGLRSELRDDAKTITDTASQRLHGEVDARKSGAAEQVKTLSSALDTAAGELKDSPAWLRSAFEQGAQALQRFAGTVEGKDSRQLAREAQQMARDNPGTFLAGCAFAGFAAARLFKAGMPESGTPGTAAWEPSRSQAEESAPPAFAFSGSSAGTDASIPPGALS